MVGGHWRRSFFVLKLFLVIVEAITANTNSKIAAAGFISIDCGATEDYVDNQTGLFYESDAKYIDTGEIYDIPMPANLILKDFPQLFKNLRSFPQGTRNCYRLRPKQGRNNNYLIRALFFYGNYNGKFQIPVFDLYLGVNKWATVDFFAYSQLEIIHFLSAEYIDVCLVKTGNGVPYISALELRPLDNSIYQINGGALLTLGRSYVGRENGYTRYPVDVYDRIWSTYNSSDWILISSESTIYTQGFDDAYKIPAEVLKTAATTENASKPLNFNFMSPSPYNASQCYIYFHFAEVEKLRDGQKRELRIDLNGVRNLTQSLKLEYLQPRTIAPNDPPITGTQLHFSIYAAEGSVVPPILNAVEAFLFIELPLSPTNLNDVNAIMDIKQIYNVTRNWQGDPCLPSNFSWDGLNCSNDTIPRINSLNLSSSRLTGEIATSFSSLEAITLLDLSYNNLSGPLREFFAQLPNLKVLNLTGNKLTGSVPDALIQKSKDGTLLLSLQENPDLCSSVPIHEMKKEFIIPGLACSTIILLILIALCALAMHRRETKREIATGSKKEGSLKSKNRKFAYSEIVGITKNFKTTIGEGGFGKVYMGTLKDGTEVAVKVLSPSSRQGYKEFQAEAQLLMIVHHRNLVSLIGYCDESENKALIYEYMVHGNLRQHLLETDTNMLSWSDRVQIAVDAAQGLDYLHNGCRPPTIHRDLKPSNILLNENMQAKLADFGLSRFIYKESETTCPAGTPGYIDPEFYASGTINKKSDVYSFGIILFELITGQPAIQRGLGNDRYILQRVTPAIDRGDIQNIVDPMLEGQFNINAAWKMVEIAVSCVLPSGVQRPDMSQVLAELKECLVIEGEPRKNLRTKSNETSSSNLVEEVCFEPGVEIVPITR